MLAHGHRAALEAVVELSTERHLAGKASYCEVLEAQQQLFPAQLCLARTERDESLSIVALYKALGGGWQNETNAPAAGNGSRLLDCFRRQGRISRHTPARCQRYLWS